MTTQSKLRKTLESLSSADLIIRGTLFEVNGESVTVDAGGAHYEVLLEHIVNAEEIAGAKQGGSVEVRIVPHATILEKRLLEPNVSGIITGSVFRGPGDATSESYRSYEYGFDECVIAHCECSRCANDCSRCICSNDCSRCNPPEYGRFAPRVWFRRLIRR